MSTVRTSRAIAVAAMALALAGCGTTPHGSAAATPPTTTPAADATSAGGTAGNIARARAEARHLLTAIALPPGGRVVASSPLAALDRSDSWMGGTDRRLAQHAWWTAPMDAARLRSWVRAHHPGLAWSGSGSSSSTDGPTTQDVELMAPDTAAYTTPYLQLTFLPYAGGVAVRLDASISGRQARTVLVPEDTTAVHVRRTTTSSGTAGPPRVGRWTVTDPNRVADLVHLANGLRGSSTVPFVEHCMMIRTEKTYVVTFSAPEGTFAITGTDFPCGPQVVLRRDGVVVGPRLDAGSWFSDVEASRSAP